MSRVCDTLWVVRHNGTQCPHCGAMPGEYHRERQADDRCTRCGALRADHGNTEIQWGSYPYTGDCPDGERHGFTMVQPEAPTRWQRFKRLIGATP